MADLKRLTVLWSGAAWSIVIWVVSDVYAYIKV
jgi:hypothetical protein